MSKAKCPDKKCHYRYNNRCLIEKCVYSNNKRENMTKIIVKKKNKT